MRSHRLLAVTVILMVLAEVFCEEMSPDEDTSLWGDRSQEDLLEPDSVRELLRRMIRKPRPEQFFGLMGRRSAGSKPLTRKRHKLESFIGLMGKRSSAADSSYEWKPVQDFIQRR
ncbi:protachykinin-1 [Callorhinchus milii]|uniref:Neurokinin A n=1 Tax=Callorhinchus milii TaxID=7868 RepID=A0A4W3HQA7_CALMI|nr:protachykinin-1 [Callorhinchus milii]|eukprot:gi/632973034/ref/XP_007902952.1/ PREDICTED: protachykinin-1 [Callorhinchus milii]